MRWIAYDQSTAEALVSRSKLKAVEVQDGDPLGAALKLDGGSWLILPSKRKGNVILAQVTPAEQLAKDDAIEMEPSGFLGLSDAPTDRTRERPGEKKTWWRRVTDSDER